MKTPLVASLIAVLLLQLSIADPAEEKRKMVFEKYSYEEILQGTLKLRSKTTAKGFQAGYKRLLENDGFHNWRIDNRKDSKHSEALQALDLHFAATAKNHLVELVVPKDDRKQGYEETNRLMELYHEGTEREFFHAFSDSLKKDWYWTFFKNIENRIPRIFLSVLGRRIEYDAEQREARKKEKK